MQFDRSRLLIGAYYFTDSFHDEAHVKEIADCGIDFLVSAKAAPNLLSLLEKYHIGLFTHSNFTMWWGGDGSKAGQYSTFMPVEEFEALAPTHVSGDALFGDYLVDEPSSKDFKHIQKIVDQYRRLFPDKFPYINLYPNYASIPSNTSDQKVSQLGNASYAEHIDQYVNELDLDYICYDFYPFTGCFDTYIENFDIVARACRKNKKDMWVIIQTGAWKKEAMIAEFQIRWQAYMALVYGAAIIMHACYCQGWWDEHTSCLNLKGEKNPTWNYAESINRELHALGPVFMKYRNTGVYGAGDLTRSCKEIKEQLERQNAQSSDSAFNDRVTISADGAVLTGYFTAKPELEQEKSSALMLVNTNNPFDGTESGRLRVALCFDAKAVPASAVVTAYIKGLPQRLTLNQDDAALLTLESGEGVFVTF
ncbi:hypothetical protein FACS189447_09010 [Spirochaetia bacterium]|nr:hypothetical protein FACS189447_09010 [Spirochaetia bacterium]